MFVHFVQRYLSTYLQSRVWKSLAIQTSFLINAESWQCRHLYCYVVKGKLISAKSFACSGN